MKDTPTSATITEEGLLDPVRLFAARESKGWGRTTLSEKSGVPYWTIANLEQGRTPNPLVLTVYRLAKALGVEVGHLLKEGGPS